MNVNEALKFQAQEEFQEIVQTLRRYKQMHVLRYFDELSDAEREELLEQLKEVDFRSLARYKQPACASSGDVHPIQAMGLEEIQEKRELFKAQGEEIIKRGELALVLLAGGQGTRLGSSLPKGMFDLGLSKPLYLFELLIGNLLEAARPLGADPYLFVMTSEKNDAVTREFLEAHAFFGYPEDKVRFFRQQMAPCVDLDGKLLLEEKGRLARSPNGNGGWYTSLLEAGFYRELAGVKWFNVFSVDNVLQRIADPVFLGAAAQSGADCAAKGVKKRDPEEKVGVLCLKDGVPTVIEYYELDADKANLRDEKGELVYSFGMTLNYLFRASALQKIKDEHIPVHVVKKKIKCLDGDGKSFEPAEPNGYKFETLILDMIANVGSCLPFEVDREREFAPVKNKTGPDSVDTARALLRKNGRIL